MSIERQFDAGAAGLGLGLGFEGAAPAQAGVGDRVPARVLFFSHDAKLGDAVVNTAFVGGLRRFAPQCQIDVTVAGATAAFWARDTRIRHSWSLQEPGWADIVATGLALRRRRYDYIVTWQRMRSEKNRLLLLLARPRALIDLDQFNRGAPRHKIESCREALRQIERRTDPALAYELSAAARCAHLDRLLPGGRELILVNLFAADRERNIGNAEAVQLLRGLRGMAPQAVLCLVCSDPSAARAREVQRLCGVPTQAINCEGNLERLIDLVGRADLVVSPDTALIHIASALDKPVIGIYQNNRTKVVQWGPLSRLHGLVCADSAEHIAGFSVLKVLVLAATLRRQYLDQRATATPA